MTSSKWLLFSVFIFSLISSSYANCFTPWGSQGNCVNIKQCEQLLSLLRQRPPPPAVLNILRKAQCGFEGIDPKVCCEIREKKLIPISTFTKPEKTKVTNEIRQQNSRPTERPTTTKTTTPVPPPIPVDDHPNRRLLDEDLCGPLADSRIYGGNLTRINEFPWMALLGYDVGGAAPEFRCGASLINKRYVLTAAHCTTSLPANLKLVSVRIGEHDISQENDCDDIETGVGLNCAAKYQDFVIERVHVHPDFSRKKLHNDIALVRLEKEADLVPANARPICLPLGSATTIKSQKVVVTGWGSTEFGLRSRKLLKVRLPIVSVEDCNVAYKYQMIKIWYKQICAGGTNKMDSCSGDSGGPLQAIAMYGGQPRIVQYGIVSFGPHSCGIEGFPGVYTSVSYYMHWILDTITE